MREHVKDIHFPDQTFYVHGGCSNPFLFFMRLGKLRTVKIGLNAFRKTPYLTDRPDSEGLEQLAKDIRVPLKMLESQLKDEESAKNILSIFQITPKRCDVCIAREWDCQAGIYRHPSRGALDLEVCTCEELRERCERLEVELRSLIDRELKDKTPLDIRRVLWAFLPVEQWDEGYRSEDEYWEAGKDEDEDEDGGAALN